MKMETKTNLFPNATGFIKLGFGEFLFSAFYLNI